MGAFAALGAAGLLLAACGSAASSRTDAGGGRDNATTQTVTMGVYPSAIWSVPIYAAEKEGFFSKHHIRAELIPAQTGPAAIAALASGSVDTISVSPEVILSAIAGGVHAQAWTGTMKNPWAILTSKSVRLRNSSYPQSLLSLKGLTVGVPAIPSAGQAMVEASLARVGLKPSDVSFRTVGIGAPALEALDNGLVQAVVVQQPVTEQLAQKTSATILSNPLKGQVPPQLRGPYLGQWSLASYLAAHRPQVREMRSALAEAYRWLKDHRNTKTVASFLRSVYKVPGLDYERMARADAKIWASSYSPQTLETWNRYDVRYGFLRSPITTSGLVWDAR